MKVKVKKTTGTTTVAGTTKDADQKSICTEKDANPSEPTAAPDDKQEYFERCTTWEIIQNVITFLALTAFFFCFCASIVVVSLHIAGNMLQKDILGWIYSFATAHPVISITAVVVAFIAFGLYALYSTGKRLLQRMTGGDEW